MSTNYEEEIKNLELKCQLESQQAALTKNDLEVIKLKQRIQDYETTRISLVEAIENTKQRIIDLKGGEENG